MIVMHEAFRVCANCKRIKTERTCFYVTRSARRRVDAWCKVCRRRHNREQGAAITAENGYAAERRRKRQRAWRERHKSEPDYRRREAERSRAYRERRSPEVIERQAQDARMRARLSRERRGLRVTDKRKRSAPGAFRDARNPHAERLDPAPLLAALPDDLSFGGKTSKDRAMCRLRDGAEHVSLAVADELLMAVGQRINDIYPEAD